MYIMYTVLSQKNLPLYYASHILVGNYDTRRCIFGCNIILYNVTVIVFLVFFELNSTLKRGYI